MHPTETAQCWTLPHSNLPYDIWRLDTGILIIIVVSMVRFFRILIFKASRLTVSGFFHGVDRNPPPACI